MIWMFCLFLLNWCCVIFFCRRYDKNLLCVFLLFIEFEFVYFLFMVLLLFYSIEGSICCFGFYWNKEILECESNVFMIIKYIFIV